MFLVIKMNGSVIVVLMQAPFHGRSLALLLFAIFLSMFDVEFVHDNVLRLPGWSSTRTQWPPCVPTAETLLPVKPLQKWKQNGQKHYKKKISSLQSIPMYSWISNQIGIVAWIAAGSCCAAGSPSQPKSLSLKSSLSAAAQPSTPHISGFAGLICCLFAPIPLCMGSLRVRNNQELQNDHNCVTANDCIHIMVAILYFQGMGHCYVCDFSLRCRMWPTSAPTATVWWDATRPNLDEHCELCAVHGTRLQGFAKRWNAQHGTT